MKTSWNFEGFATRGQSVIVKSSESAKSTLHSAFKVPETRPKRDVGRSTDGFVVSRLFSRLVSKTQSTRIVPPNDNKTLTNRYPFQSCKYIRNKPLNYWCQLPSESCQSFFCVSTTGFNQFKKCIQTWKNGFICQSQTLQWIVRTKRYDTLKCYTNPAIIGLKIGYFLAKRLHFKEIQIGWEVFLWFDLVWGLKNLRYQDSIFKIKLAISNRSPHFDAHMHS